MTGLGREGRPRRRRPHPARILLTDLEYDALAGAVALQECDLQDRADSGEHVGRELGALARAWSKVQDGLR